MALVSSLDRSGPGREANHIGRHFEDVIADILRGAGLQAYSKNCQLGPGLFPWFSPQHTIGSGAWKKVVDFVICPSTQYPTGICVEARAQNVSGSADEKFAQLREMIANGTYRGMAVAVVIDGNGASKRKLERWNYFQHRDFIGLFTSETFSEFIHRQTWMTLGNI